MHDWLWEMFRAALGSFLGRLAAEGLVRRDRRKPDSHE